MKENLLQKKVLMVKKLKVSEQAEQVQDFKIYLACQQAVCVRPKKLNARFENSVFVFIKLHVMKDYIITR